MRLKEYLMQVSTAELARRVGVAPAMVYQWAHGIRPVPISRCHDVVKGTMGKVSLKDLRPKDWEKIWPELAEK